MTALEPLTRVDQLLTGDVLAHLDAQLVSARRLLQIVLEQGAAIRDREVQKVVTLTGLLQVELQRRQLIENERARLLERAGAQLGVASGAVTLTLMERLMEPSAARLAQARSGELRGLLEQVQREHYVNRALMNQELAFLDHLLRLAHGDSETVYDAAGERPLTSSSALAARHRVLDLEV